MRNIKTLLIAVDGSPTTPLVLDKAAMLAAASGADAHVVQVIYEPMAEVKARGVESPEALKDSALEAAEQSLAAVVAHHRDRFSSLHTACVWHRRPWQGILSAAKSVDADMILQAASVHSRLDEIIHTPDDWNVLRHADVPVMLVKPEPWVDDPVILAALDIFDNVHRPLNLEILHAATELVKILGGELHTVTAYPRRPASGARTVGSSSEETKAVSYDVFRAAFESDIRMELDSLKRELGVEVAEVHAGEGGVGHLIRQVAEETHAEMIVLGTHGRGGIRGVLLGNTAERILHTANTADVVTIHD